MDGVFQLSSVHDENVHESFVCDTRDHEDHTFCGIMFDVRCESALPLEYLEIGSISVRGDLGLLTVWHTPDSFREKQDKAARAEWTKLYEGAHAPSRETAVALCLDTPIRLRRGQSCGLYVHSAAPGDDAIVYDNVRGRGGYTFVDRCLRVLPGMAHLSNRPFGDRGMWGSAWRRNREFVGRVSYGVRWKMWAPEVHEQFPPSFRAAVTTMLMASRRPESLMYLLHDYSAPRLLRAAAHTASCHAPTPMVCRVLSLLAAGGRHHITSHSGGRRLASRAVVFFILNKCEWWEWCTEHSDAPAPRAPRSAPAAHSTRTRDGGTASGLSAAEPALPPRGYLGGHVTTDAEAAARAAPLGVRRARKRPLISLLPPAAAGACAARVATPTGAEAAAEAYVAAGEGEAASAACAACAACASCAASAASAISAGGSCSSAYAAADEERTGLGGGFRERDEGAEGRRQARREQEAVSTQARKQANRRCDGCRRFSCICCE
jgi:hypothetical protein